MHEITVTDALIRATLDQYPDLTPNGFGGSDGQDFALPEERDPAQIQRIVEHLLRHYPKGVCVNHDALSYSLKHDYEHHSSEYVTNGAFILAALIAGYEHEAAGLNACFDMRHRNVARAPGRAGSRWAGRSGELLRAAAGTPDAPDIDWAAEEYFGDQFVTVRDAAEAIIAESVIDMRDSYDPDDEQDPAEAFEAVLREDLRLDGASSTGDQALAAELRIQTRTEVWSEEPRPGCLLGRYVVTIQGEVFRGSLVDTARGWMLDPFRRTHA